MLKRFVIELFKDIINVVGIETLKGLYADKKSQPACLVYTPTATAIVINDNPVPVGLNIFQLIPFGDLSEEYYTVLTRLNHELQLRENPSL